MSYTYPASGASSVRPHAVTSTSNGGNFSYDANGNMTSRRLQSGGTTYSQQWDYENRLKQVTYPGHTTAFTYDGNGALVKRVVDGVTTVYVGSHYEKQGSTVIKYYFFGAQRVAMNKAGVVQYLLGDHLGSTSLVLNAGGAKVAESRYFPYGETRWTDGTLPTDYQFTGQRKEESLGLYQMGARWYDSALGRWLSADTIVPQPGNPQAFNRYSYVAGNPLKYVDPTGHKEEGECSFGDEGCEGQPPTVDEIIAEILQGMIDAINDPARTEPIVISIPGSDEKIIIMPVESSPYVHRSEIIKEFGRALSRGGLYLDIAELVLIADILPGDEEFMGGVDFAVTGLADWASGSSGFFQQIHPSLPPVAFVGQDTLWTGGVDTVVPAAAKALGSSAAGPAGYGFGLTVDTITTGSSVLHDAGRNLGIIPNVLKRGQMYNGGLSFTNVWIIYPSELH